jgi:hypothetical protein
MSEYKDTRATESSASSTATSRAGRGKRSDTWSQQSLQEDVAALLSRNTARPPPASELDAPTREDTENASGIRSKGGDLCHKLYQVQASHIAAAFEVCV